LRRADLTPPLSLAGEGLTANIRREGEVALEESDEETLPRAHATRG